MFILGVIKACWTIYRRIYTGIQNLCLKLISVGTNQQQKKKQGIVVLSRCLSTVWNSVIVTEINLVIIIEIWMKIKPINMSFESGCQIKLY